MIKQFKTVIFNNINFFVGNYFEDENIYDEEDFYVSQRVIYTEDMLPGFGLYLNNVNFVDNFFSQLIPKFYLFDLSILSIKNFSYKSINNKQKDEITGFKMFII